MKYADAVQLVDRLLDSAELVATWARTGVGDGQALLDQRAEAERAIIAALTAEAP